tara:strand:+ start:743 stop:3271 length:2529 start_codon:yes stop_codon:yes gene_type:complete
MFKRNASSSIKFIGKSGYIFALAMPFISLSGDTKASTQLSGENKLFAGTKHADNFQFNKTLSENILNYKSEIFLLSEKLSNDSKKKYIKICTKKETQSGGSEEDFKYWNKCSIEEAEKSEKGRELMKRGTQSLSESCIQGICTTVQVGTKEQLGEVEKEINDKQKTPLEEEQEKKVLISEIIIKGLEDHPDRERLEVIAYDAMLIRPGSKVTRDDVKNDLDRIYSSGWFAGARIESLKSPLGVQLLIKVEPNPILNKIKILPDEKQISNLKVNEIFNNDYGKTLNLNVLKIRVKEIKDWYNSKGYSLARISGPRRITNDGIVVLNIQEGYIDGIEIKFIDEDGNEEDEKGRIIKGKTKKWVIQRELITKVGDIFNRTNLESDIRRLYSTSLFTDVKVTLRPVKSAPGNVIIVLAITEQRTGSLTGGIGYSGGQGVFGQAGLQESNLGGRAWTSNMNLTYGEYGALLNLSLYDPWIKNDKHRTSFRTSLYLSREVPQEFRSRDGGSIRGVTDRYEAVNSSTSYDINVAQTSISLGPFSTINDAKSNASQYSWFDYEGDSLVLERTGGGFSFARPLNGGQPLKKVPWSVLVGANFQQVRPIDYSGAKRPYGVASPNLIDNKVPENEVICVAYNCADENTLVSFKSAISYNNLNDARNPTSGDYLNIGSEQFISVGDNSPTFNRSTVSYSRFYPVNLLKFHKGCRPKPGEKLNCAQSIGFQAKMGTIIGELPPYEAFCLGGNSSVRGWSSCDLGVARNIGEATAEYRFPVWRLLSGLLFIDAGTDFGSQSDVPGKPGTLLAKSGSGFSVGPGAIINTPVGPIRLEAASKDLSGDWRYNIGVGWKF